MRTLVNLRSFVSRFPDADDSIASKIEQARSETLGSESSSTRSRLGTRGAAAVVWPLASWSAFSRFFSFLPPLPAVFARTQPARKLIEFLARFCRHFVPFAVTISTAGTTMTSGTSLDRFAIDLSSLPSASPRLSPSAVYVSRYPIIDEIVEETREAVVMLSSISSRFSLSFLAARFLVFRCPVVTDGNFTRTARRLRGKGSLDPSRFAVLEGCEPSREARNAETFRKRSRTSRYAKANAVPR